MVTTQIVFYFPPENWGRWTHFDEHIYQRGWFNHQRVEVFCCFFSGVIKWDPFWWDHFQCKCMVTLRDFPYNSPLVGLVSYNEPGFFFKVDTVQRNTEVDMKSTVKQTWNETMLCKHHTTWRSSISWLFCTSADDPPGIWKARKCKADLSNRTSRRWSADLKTKGFPEDRSTAVNQHSHLFGVFVSRWIHFPIRWDSLRSFLWRVTTEMKENLILSYLKKKVSLCAFVNPKIPPSFQRTMCFDSSYHASGSDPVKWWGNPFKTARAELGENGKMYFTTDFFLEQSLQKDFKSYIKHCFDSMCFWYVIQFPRTQLTSIFEGQQGQNSNENKGHLASRYIFLLGYSPSQ